MHASPRRQRLATALTVLGILFLICLAPGCQVNALRAEQTALRSSTESNADQLTCLTEQVAAQETSLHAALNALEAQQQAQEQTLHAIRTQQSHLERQVAQAAQQGEDSQRLLAAQVATLTETQATVQSDLSDLEADVAAARGEQSRLARQVETDHETVAAVVADQEEATGHLTQLAESLTREIEASRRYAQEVQSLTEAWTQHQDAAEQLSAKIDTLTAGQADLGRALAANKERVAAQVADLQDDTGQWQSQLHELRTSIEELARDKSVLEARLAELQEATVEPD